VAYAIAGLLRAFPIHAARGQIYLPAELMNRYRAQASDALAGKDTVELRATLAELRLWARQHLAAARALLSGAPPQALPALLPVALVRPVLDRMERRGYRPFHPVAIAPWRAPWALWRAARSDLRTAF
jgi:phytoene synthase